MSLLDVINTKTIGERNKKLSSYLKNNKIGNLNEQEIHYFKILFEIHYTPDIEYQETKFTYEQIMEVALTDAKYNNKCFQINVDDTWYPCSIKRLSGSKRKEESNLNRALRLAIESQITEFKYNNPLNVNQLCPVHNISMGIDAQVDHEIPFKELVTTWKKTNKNIKYHYDLNKKDYILEEPWHNSWCKFHKINAKLRWLSKEGNRYAHRLYNGPSII